MENDRAGGLPPLIPEDDAVYESVPAGRKRTERRTLTLDRDHVWSAALGSGFVAVLVLAALGFLEPWISVDRDLASAPSYSAIDVPVVVEVGALWVAILVVLAIVAWATRQRWLFVIGALATLVTAVMLGVLAILFHVVPHLLPFWLIPKRARPYVPDIAGGPGPTFAFLSSLLLLAWFFAAAFVRPSIHRAGAGRLHRVERQVETLWARIDPTSRTSAQGGDLPPLT